MPRKSVSGNTDTNTDCNPESSRSLGSLSICRKRSYERRCTSIRLGICVAVGIFEKSSRLRIARFSLGMFTPEARQSGSGAACEGPDPGQRPSPGAPADYGKKIEYPNQATGLEN